MRRLLFTFLLLCLPAVPARAVNLRSQTLSANTVTLVGTNGVTVTLTKAEIQAFYQTTSGSASVRKAAVVNWAVGQLSSRLGGNLISPDKFTIDFDTSTFDINRLEVRS